MIPDVLIQISRLDYQSDFISLYAGSPFRNDVLFQITWNQHKAQWFRYILIESTPPYKVQKAWGSAKPDIILPIWQKLRSLVLPARFDCGVMGRDGYAFRVEVGNDFAHLAYQWYEFALPDGWEELNMLARELTVWQESLVSVEQELYEIHYEEHETDTETSLFWEIKIV